MLGETQSLNRCILCPILLTAMASVQNSRHCPGLCARWSGRIRNLLIKRMLHPNDPEPNNQLHHTQIKNKIEIKMNQKNCHVKVGHLVEDRRGLMETKKRGLCHLWSGWMCWFMCFIKRSLDVRYSTETDWKKKKPIINDSKCIWKK